MVGNGVHEKGRGKVQITNTPRMDGKAIRHTVDVGRMGYGESKVLEREDGEEDVVVNLIDEREARRGKRDMTQVVMKWD